jgi:predicted AAA+ superfamily ATPase
LSLKPKNYMPRIADGQIERYLRLFGAVSIEGPKWCGKTWTGLNNANSAVYINDSKSQSKSMAELDPALILDGKSPRLIDEWQEVPKIWDAVRFKVDENAEKGMFILTGSATPKTEGIMHSGAGRIGSIRMRSMSLYESGDSSGDVSLQGLFDNVFENCFTGEKTLKEMIGLTVRGGWPDTIGKSSYESQKASKKYLRTILNECTVKTDGKRRDLNKMRAFVRSISRNECTVVSNSTLAKDMEETDAEKISVQTVADYLNVLERLYIIEKQLSFNPGMRSSVRVGKSPKRRFTDPSLAAAALGATPEKLSKDLNTYGFLFESMCIRDLTVYAESLGAEVFHYRDGEGREIDAIVELPDKRWGAFEIKLGANRIDEAAENLIKFEEKIEGTRNSEKPDVLCVICGLSSAAYRREDGVYVVPVTALRN